MAAENSPASIKAAKKAADVVKKSHEDEFKTHHIMGDEEFIFELYCLVPYFL